MLFNKIALSVISLALIALTLLFVDVALHTSPALSAWCSMYAFVVGLFAVVVSVSTACWWAIKEQGESDTPDSVGAPKFEHLF